jgi:hypothetical protein
LTAARPGALDAVARLADPESVLGLLEVDLDRPPNKLTRAGAHRDPWRVVGPLPTQPFTPVRGRLVLAGCGVPVHPDGGRGARSGCQTGATTSLTQP